MYVYLPPYPDGSFSLRNLLFPSAEPISPVNRDGDVNSEVSSILVEGSSFSSAAGSGSSHSSEERSFLSLSPIGEYSFFFIFLCSSFSSCLLGY